MKILQPIGGLVIYRYHRIFYDHLDYHDLPAALRLNQTFLTSRELDIVQATKTMC